MPFNHILAMGSERGDILLYDESDDFMASLKNGTWMPSTVFDGGDIYENFFHITDDEEILRLMNEARSALGVPFPGD